MSTPEQLIADEVFNRQFESIFGKPKDDRLKTTVVRNSVAGARNVPAKSNYTKQAYEEHNRKG